MSKISNIEKIGKEKLQIIVNNSSSYREILNKCKLSAGTSNYPTLHRFLKKWNINCCGLVDRRHIARAEKLKKAQLIPLENILTTNSNYNRFHLKKRLINSKMIKEECYICKLGPEWNGNPLSLQMDHINGDPIDNRLPNIRLLCPNCHSQTSNFAGKKHKNKKRKREEILYRS